MKIYTAGPLGFSEAGRHFHQCYILPMLQKLGCEILDPWVQTDSELIQSVAAIPFGKERRDAWKSVNPTIAANNTRALDECDVVFAVLDGTDVDSGTAAEIGYAFARGKLIHGYRGDFRLSADNEGSTVNLQVEYFIRSSGGSIASTMQEAEKLLIEALANASRK